MNPAFCDPSDAGLSQLRAARRDSRALYWAVGLFSGFANLLMLTGPLYMLQVYDRVLSSRSVETLVALTLLVAFLYGIMGLLDYTRGRVLARIGARFQDRLDKPVFDAVMAHAAQGQNARSQTGLTDLEAVQRFIASPAPTAVFDMPWTPVFLLGISIFHPWLGYLAVAGGALLILLAALNQWVTRQPVHQSSISAHRAAHLGEQLRAEADMLRGLGMQHNGFQRWKARRRQALDQTLAATDMGGGFTALTKTFRLFLQSAMLGLGALLVLRGEMTAGAMIAGSILMGRALAPIELAIGQWPVFLRARKAWGNLAILLAEAPMPPARTDLPAPKPRLEVQSLTIVPPGVTAPSLRNVSFVLEAGTALGVIGPSGAGKSTLARAMTGTWGWASGSVRLDQAALDQYAPDQLAGYIGYLPQRVALFDGTIAQNIARLAPDPDDKMVVQAAQRADAHEMIVQLPQGYDTWVSSTGGPLSGGQIQRIGLARALYSDPVLLVLDEPNSNLDHLGAQALNRVIRRMKAKGRSVVIMAHRPAAIRECDTLLVLKAGLVTAFGPRDEVLRRAVDNHQDIQRLQSIAGGL